MLQLLCNPNAAIPIGLLLALAVPKVVSAIFFRDLDLWTAQPHASWTARMFYGGVQSFAKYWHGYEVHGLGRLPPGPVLLVGYHSRATVDGVYAAAFLQPTTLMSPIFFAVPGAESLFASIHCVSTHDQSKSAEDSFLTTVTAGPRPVMLFPGGHHECFKRLAEKHVVRWRERPGFARALLADEGRRAVGRTVSVVPFYTNNCEDIYPTTKWWYDYSGQMVQSHFHEFENGAYYLLPFLLPLSLMALGFLPLPRPVKLDLYIGEPLRPRDNETDIAFAKRVVVATQATVDTTRKKHEGDGAGAKSYNVQRCLYAIYMLVQNTVMWTIIVILNVLVVPIAIAIRLFVKVITNRTRHKKQE